MGEKKHCKAFKSSGQKSSTTCFCLLWLCIAQEAVESWSDWVDVAFSHSLVVILPPFSPLLNSSRCCRPARRNQPPLSFAHFFCPFGERSSLFRNPSQLAPCVSWMIDHFVFLRRTRDLFRFHSGRLAGRLASCRDGFVAGLSPLPHFVTFAFWDSINCTSVHCSATVACLSSKYIHYSSFVVGRTCYSLIHPRHRNLHTRWKRNWTKKLLWRLVCWLLDFEIQVKLFMEAFAMHRHTCSRAINRI